MTSGGQAARIGRFREANDGEALAAGIVEQDAMLFAGPDGVRLQKPRALGFKKQSTRPTFADNDRLIKRCVPRIKAIVVTEDGQYMLAQDRHGRQTSNGFHTALPENQRSWASGTCPPCTPITEVLFSPDEIIGRWPPMDG